MRASDWFTLLHELNSETTMGCLNSSPWQSSALTFSFAKRHRAICMVLRREASLFVFEVSRRDSGARPRNVPVHEQIVSHQESDGADANAVRNIANVGS